MPQNPVSPRDALGEKFIADVLADWQQNGKKVIAALRDERPSDYVRIVAAILPKERNARPDPIDELTDAELFERIARVAARAGLDVRVAGPRDGAGPAHDAASARR